jgi:hypothetical protein
VACGAPVDVHLPDIQAAGVSLAAGDKFTAGDYTVVITEISSGDPSGYIGTGYVEMRLVAEIVAKKIAVDFTNLVVNTCYEMAAGDVVTQYDPNWGGILDVDLVIADALTAYEKVSNILGDLFSAFNGTCAEIIKIEKEINNLETAFALDPTQSNDVSTSIAELKASVQSLKACASCGSSYINQNTSSGRISATQNCNSIFKTCEEKKAVFDQLTILNSTFIANITCEKLTKILVKPYTQTDNDNCVLKGEVRINISKNYRPDILKCAFWLEDGQWIVWTGTGSKLFNVPIGDNYDEDTISFDKAARHNIANNLYLNYPNIGSRHAWYSWADKIVKPKNNYWFAAAVDVTSWRAVGAADNWNFGFIVKEEEFIMREINKRLIKQNFENFENYLITPGAKITFQGNPVNLTGLALEAKMVEIEQTEVENYIAQTKSAFEAKYGNSRINCSVGSGPGRVLTPWKCAIKGINIVSDGTCQVCYFDGLISSIYGASFKGDAFSNAMADFKAGIEYNGRRKLSNETYNFLNINHRIYIGQRMAHYIRLGLE